MLLEVRALAEEPASGEATLHSVEKDGRTSQRRTRPGVLLPNDGRPVHFTTHCGLESIGFNTFRKLACLLTFQLTCADVILSVRRFQMVGLGPLDG